MVRPVLRCSAAVLVLVGGMPGLAGTAVASCTVPGAPTAVTATPANGSAPVSWTAPASDGGCGITGYTVAATPGGATATTSSTSTTVSGLTNGSPYAFSVRATNSAGSGPASALSDPVTPRTVPGAPTGVAGTPADQSVEVRWDVPASDGGSPVTSYTVTAAPGGATATTSSTSATVSGLTNGTSYTFTVRATNAAGQGAASAASAAVKPRALPGAPTNVTATTSRDTATVSWTWPSANGSPIESYVVTSSPGALVATTAGSNATVRGLTIGTSYTFTVRARNAAGTGPASAPSNAVTPSDWGGAPPTNVVATAGTNQATVTWTAPVGTVTPDLYYVTGSPGNVSAFVAHPTTTATVTGLRGGTTYTFTVLARYYQTFGTPSAASAPVTTTAARPGQPTGVSATETSSGRATVTWTAAPANGATITGYRVMRSPAGSGCQEVPATATSALFTDLRPGETYVFTVTAHTAGHVACKPSYADGPRSDPTSPLTLSGAVPRTPTVTAFAGDGAVTVRWRLDSSLVTSYTVSATPTGGGATVSRTVGGTAVMATLAGLANGTAYTISVTATNASGSGTAATAGATPQAALVDQLETLMSGSVRGAGPSVSDDGRYVVWFEQSSSGDAGDWYPYSVMLADRTAKVVYLIGHQHGGNTSFQRGPGAISGNGRYVALASAAALVTSDVNERPDAYVYDRQTGGYEVVSSPAAGESDGDVSHVAISPDGRYVVFRSSASNLVAGDTNGSHDLFLRDRTTGSLERVSIAPTGRQLVNVSSGIFAVSADGRYVAGTSDSGAFRRDRQTGTTLVFSGPTYFLNLTSSLHGMTRDGAQVTFFYETDANAEGRVPPGSPATSYVSLYRADVATGGPATIVSVADNGNDLVDVAGGALSPDGTIATFLINVGQASTLAVRDLSAGVTAVLVGAVSTSTYPGGGGAVSANNRTVVLGYTHSYPDHQVRAVEYLRAEAAQGRVWWATWRQSVNTATGAFNHAWTDASIPSVGPDLSVVRSYDSGDTANGAFGIGFRASFEHALEKRGGAVVVRYPDGRVESHSGAGPTYTPPKGVSSTLVRDVGTGVYRLTDRTNTVVTFSPVGRPTSITDPQGHVLAFGYSGGRVATLTDQVSGRALTLTWSGGHVAEVRTPTVAQFGGPLVWTYTYDGDLLDAVCAPPGAGGMTRCTDHDWTAERLTAMRNPNGQQILAVAYGADGRVSSSATDGSHASTFAYEPRATTVTDPRGFATRAEFDGYGRFVRQVDPYGKVVTFAYDANGFPASRTDEGGNTTRWTYSASGDKLQETAGVNAARGLVGAAAYLEYEADHDLVSARDRRSASPTDTTYRTAYVTDANHNVTSITAPTGEVRSWTYSAGTEAAIGGGTVPPALPLTSTDGRGKVTTYRYDAQGDLREVENPAGAIVRHGHDELGRVTSTTTYSDAFPAGVTTTFALDEVGRTVTTTGPVTTDAVTGTTHRLRVTTVYDASGRATSETREDLETADPARVTTYGYDAVGRVTSVTDDETDTAATREYDASGNLAAVVDRLGRRTEFSYTKTNLVAQAARGTVVLGTRTYDDQGRLRDETDVLGRTYRFTYDADNRVTRRALLSFADPGGATRDVVVDEFAYDKAGNVVRRWADWKTGRRRYETFAYDAANRLTESVLDPAGLNRVTAYTWDGAGNELSRTLTSAGFSQSSTRTYDALGHVASETVENGSADVTTWTTYDDRGLLVATTDGRGSGAGDAAYTSTVAYDELGRPVGTTSAPVTVAVMGTADHTASPSTATGYDAFGNVVHTRDARGAVTTYGFDKLDRQVRRDLPSYLRPDGATLAPFETWTFDAADRLTRSRDVRGGITDYSYDALDHLQTVQGPVVGAVRPTTTYVHDDAGRTTRVTDPVGVVVETDYDMRDRVVATRRLLRSPTATAETTFGYDDLGNRTSARSPLLETTAYAYSVAGELLSETDPTGEVWSYGYDGAGRRTSAVDPLTRSTVVGYDGLGRPTSTTRLDATGATMATESTTYDAAGNAVTRTSPLGFATTYTYDAANRLTSVVDPVTATTTRTTSYAYDEAGLLTRTTNGRNIATWRTYNVWGLLEQVVEPSTATHPDLADRRWRVSYDGSGLPVREERPGGVGVERIYDGLGRLTGETGGGTGVVSATRSFGYDLAGRVTSVGHPSGVVGVDWDDRGVLRAVSGPAGSAAYTYDLDGRLTRRVDASGTNEFTWTARGELETAKDGLTGVTRTFGYDGAGQLDTVGFGVGNGSRVFDQDALGRVVSDAVKDAAGVVQGSVGYGYDADGNVTSQVVAYPGNPGNGTHSYAYDQAGRLTSWTRPGTGGTVAFGWDGADNLIASGGATLGYDERDRVVSRGLDTFRWSARGTLEAVVSPGVPRTYVFDGLDRLVVAGAASYSYDSLDRVAAKGLSSFAYAGLSVDPVSDGTSSFAQDPSGAVSAVSVGGAARLATLNRHGDLAGLVDAVGVPSASRVYAPFGGDAGSVGSTGALGFQADVTDAGSGLVWMGARWYDPGVGVFLSRDVMATSADGGLVNRYGYAAGNPVTLSDPDGRCAVSPTGWGGCAPDAGGGTWAVRVAAGAYTDSSWRVVMRSPARPGAESSTSDGLDWDEDPDIGMLYRLHADPSVLFRAVGETARGVRSAVLAPVRRLADRAVTVAGHLTDWRQVVRDVVNLPSAAVNGTERLVEGGLDLASLVLSGVSFGRVPRFHADGTLPRVGYVFDDARSREASSLTEDLFMILPPVGLAAKLTGKLARSNRITRGLDTTTDLPRTTPALPTRAAPAANTGSKVVVAERVGGQALKPSEAVSRWDEFLGAGQTNLHPRTGLPDANRLVSADGARSIRFGSHETGSSPTKFHFHEETWNFHEATNTWFVDSLIVRVPFPKGSW